jgi:VWFA-related protein
VVVTDRAGRRVPGLTAADFRLLVDGREVTVDSFEEVRDGAVVLAALPGEAAAAPAPARVEPASYLIFIDDAFSVRPERRRVLRRLRDDLGLLRPEDRVAVAVFDGERLELRSRWDDGPAGARRALGAALEDRVGHGLLLKKARYQGLGGVAEGTAGIERRLAGPLEFAARELGEEIERSVAAAVATLARLPDPGGRKAMLVVTGGWPLDPYAYLAGTHGLDLVTACQNIQRQRAGVLASFGEPLGRGQVSYAPLVDVANLLGYTVYMVDAAAFDVESVGMGRGAGAGPLPSFARMEDLMDTLRLVAGETGGRPLLRNQAARALEVAAADAGSYYRLGYAPEWPRDDRRREIEVQVLRPGLTARARRTVLASSVETEVGRVLDSLLRFSGGLPEEVEIAVSSLDDREVDRGLRSYRVAVAVPAAALTPDPGAQGYYAAGELYFGVADAAGTPEGMLRAPLAFAGPRAPAAGEYLVQGFGLAAPRDQRRLVVLVRDPVTGRLAMGRAELPRAADPRPAGYAGPS